MLTEIMWGKCVSTFVTFDSFKLSSVHPGLLFCLLSSIFLARESLEFIRNISVLIDFVTDDKLQKGI